MATITINLSKAALGRVIEAYQFSETDDVVVDADYVKGQLIVQLQSTVRSTEARKAKLALSAEYVVPTIT